MAAWRATNVSAAGQELDPEAVFHAVQEIVTGAESYTGGVHNTCSSDDGGHGSGGVGRPEAPSFALPAGTVDVRGPLRGGLRPAAG